MVKVKKEGIILEKTELGFENDGVFNPAAILKDGNTHLLYRAVKKGNISSIGYCELKKNGDPLNRQAHPIIFPEYDYEKQGVEDPRIVKIDDTYFITYTAYDGKNALGALATSKDLKTFVKHGIIVPQFTYKDFGFCIECCTGLSEKYLRFYKLFKERLGKVSIENFLVWDKDVIFFPRKINGKFAFLHRLYPSIQIVYFDKIEDLNDKFWREYLFNLDKHIMLDSIYRYEASYIGGGCPPIETEDGWLIIYHGVEDTTRGYIYHATAALMDINDPTQEIGRLKAPLFSPTEIWEKEGCVNNVVFPSGVIVSDDHLYIYYGAADTCVGLATVKLSELLTELKNSKS